MCCTICNSEHGCTEIPSCSLVPIGVKLQSVLCQLCIECRKKVENVRKEIADLKGLISMSQDDFKGNKELVELRQQILEGFPTESICNDKLKARTDFVELAGPFTKLPPEVLDDIWARLPPRDIKTLRLTNSFLYHATSYRFSQVPIRIRCGSSSLGLYLDNYHKFNHQDISFITWVASDIEEIIPFVKANGYKFRKLEISHHRSTEKPEHVQFLHELLNASRNVERLELTVSSDDADSFWWYPTNLTNPFKNLVSIKLLHHEKHKIGHKEGRVLPRKLMEDTPHVRELTFTFLTSFSLATLDLMSKDAILWPKLEKLQFSLAKGMGFSGTLPPTVLKLNRPLKSISIGELPVAQISSFIKLLENHKGTLETVSVNVTTEMRMNEEYEEYELPAMLKLKKFTFANCDGESAGDLWGGRRNYFGIQDLLQNPAILHFKFPQLHTLGLLNTKFCARFYNSLFPQYGKIIQIRWLDMEYPKRDKDPRRYLHWCRRLACMFPRVNNPHFNYVREIHFTGSW